MAIDKDAIREGTGRIRRSTEMPMPDCFQRIGREMAARTVILASERNRRDTLADYAFG